jgi:hypothetical protein
MTSERERQDQDRSASVSGPGDVPAERPESLDRLDMLLGVWDMEATFEAGYFGPESPAITSHGGKTTFNWVEGRFFLVQRFVTEHPAAPSGLAIIGRGEDPDAFAQHYYDSRGVARVYQMSLDRGVWKVWRQEPAFWQRYTGVISADGTAITGAWAGSTDGRAWKHDFGLNYFKTE